MAPLAGRILLFPLVAMWGGFMFALYTVLVSGEINVVSSGYRQSSSTYAFDEHPVAFVLFLSLYAALAMMLGFAIVLVARRVLVRTRS